MLVFKFRYRHDDSRMLIRPWKWLRLEPIRAACTLDASRVEHSHRHSDDVLV